MHDLHVVCLHAHLYCYVSGRAITTCVNILAILGTPLVMNFQLGLERDHELHNHVRRQIGRVGRVMGWGGSGELRVHACMPVD